VAVYMSGHLGIWTVGQQAQWTWKLHSMDPCPLAHVVLTQHLGPNKELMVFISLLHAFVLGYHTLSVNISQLVRIMPSAFGIFILIILASAMVDAFAFVVVRAAPSWYKCIT